MRLRPIRRVLEQKMGITSKKKSRWQTHPRLMEKKKNSHNIQSPTAGIIVNGVLDRRKQSLTNRKATFCGHRICSPTGLNSWVLKSSIFCFNRRISYKHISRLRHHPPSLYPTAHLCVMRRHDESRELQRGHGQEIVHERMPYAMSRYQNLVDIIDCLMKLSRCDLPMNNIGSSLHV